MTKTKSHELIPIIFYMTIAYIFAKISTSLLIFLNISNEYIYYVWFFAGMLVIQLILREEIAYGTAHVEELNKLLEPEEILKEK